MSKAAIDDDGDTRTVTGRALQEISSKLSPSASRPGARLDLLDRSQRSVVRKLQETLPRIWDSPLHCDLKDLLEVHERNIRQCTDLR